MKETWLGFSLLGFQQVDRSESLRRFIFNESKVDRKKNVPKPNAFLPSPDDWGMSTYRTKGIPERRLLRIGRFLGEATNEGLVAQASIPVEAIEKVGLTVERDKLPSLHVNVKGWIHGVDDEHKGKRKLIAEKLVLAATLLPASG